MFTEDTLFEMLKDWYHTDLVRAKDIYSSYDCYSSESKMFFELKCRDTHYDQLLIEKMKYDHLIELAQSFSFEPIYVCSTPNGVWEFNINAMDMVWFEQDDLPATSQFSNRERVTKTVGYLDIASPWCHKIYPIDFDDIDDDWDTYEADWSSL